MTRRPNLVAFVCTSIWVLVLCAPMVTGRFLVGSDQYLAGYGFRQFWTEYVRAHGALPLWNPYIFGGLPYVGAMHGDLLYPFTWIRLLVPTDTAMNLAFLVHLILAGFFTYLLLRALRLPWVAAVTGGVAYQLTGMVASLVHPGHDGKLYVSTMLPLVLLALVKWIRDGRWEGLGLLGVGVGLAVLSPSFQMAYYMLIAAGLFALYLAFYDVERPPRRTAWIRLAGAMGGVVAGFALAAVQVLPFLAYLPFSPRSVPGTSTGWAYATAYALPPEELLDALLPQFSGFGDTYWGRNFLKLHTEYLGVAPLILATLGLARTSRPRLRWAFVVIAALFLLVSLGGHTPFYYLWYEVMPLMKKVRAPGMAFYLVSFSVAVWAALGVERLQQGGERALAGVTGWIVGLGVMLLLAFAGVFTNLGRALADPRTVPLLLANQDAVTWGAVRSALAGAVTVGFIAAWRTGRVMPKLAPVALVALLGLDLWSVDRQYFVFSPAARTLYAPDEITTRMQQAPRPYRVLDPGVYGPNRPAAILMAYDIPQVLGYHGNEIRYYDDLLGGKNEWRHLGSPQLWKLLAVRFVVFGDSATIAGYHRVLGPARTAQGGTGYLYEADTPPPYVRVVPAAVKVEAERIIPTLLDARLDFNRVVLLDPGQPVNPLPVTEMPQPSPARAQVTAWEPGKMTIAIDPAPPAPSYVLVAENWYRDWQATVDGAPAQVLRGDQSLITVSVPAGAKRVDLAFHSAQYARGKLVSFAATLLLLGLMAGPSLAAWRGRGGPRG